MDRILKQGKGAFGGATCTVLLVQSLGREKLQAEGQRAEDLESQAKEFGFYLLNFYKATSSMYQISKWPE